MLSVPNLPFFLLLNKHCDIACLLSFNRRTCDCFGILEISKLTDHLVLQYIFDAIMCPTPIRVAGECLFKIASDTFSEIRVSFKLYYHISSAYV